MYVKPKMSISSGLGMTHNTQKSIRKAPLQSPALKMTVRGFAVYFFVDRCRRKVAIGYKVSAGSFLCN